MPKLYLTASRKKQACHVFHLPVLWTLPFPSFDSLDEALSVQAWLRPPLQCRCASQRDRNLPSLASWVNWYCLGRRGHWSRRWAAVRKELMDDFFSYQWVLSSVMVWLREMSLRQSLIIDQISSFVVLYWLISDLQATSLL